MKVSIERQQYCSGKSDVNKKHWKSTQICACLTRLRLEYGSIVRIAKPLFSFSQYLDECGKDVILAPQYRVLGIFVICLHFTIILWFTYEMSPSFLPDNETSILRNCYLPPPEKLKKRCCGDVLIGHRIQMSP